MYHILLLFAMLNYKRQRWFILVKICLSHPMGDVMTEVSVMYMIVHPIRDRWGGVLMHGGWINVGVFPSWGKVYVG